MTAENDVRSTDRSQGMPSKGLPKLPPPGRSGGDPPLGPSTPRSPGAMAMARSDGVGVGPAVGPSVPVLVGSGVEPGVAVDRLLGRCVGFGLGLLVPLGLGFDVATGLGVGLGVGFGVGLGVGFGVGLGVAGGATVMVPGETLDSVHGLCDHRRCRWSPRSCRRTSRRQLGAGAECHARLPARA